MTVRTRSRGRAALLLSVPGLCLACAEVAPPPRGPAVERPSFSGEAAYALVRTQLEFGPRVPGTQGHAAQLQWMGEWLAARADRVVLDRFDYVTTLGDTLALSNVRAIFNPEAERAVLLLAHWDTRPRADQAEDETQRELPVPGANDGGSGTAILLHLAELMARQRPSIGVDLLFVDGEDYGPTIDDMLIGSKRFAANLPEDRDYAYGVLLDMVGDADPLFPIEGHSAQAAPQIAQRVWGFARDLGYARYFPTRVGISVQDDHVPLIEAGLPTIDIIDFEYGPDNQLWHTPDDRLDNVAPYTLGMVGEVVAELVYRGG